MIDSSFSVGVFLGSLFGVLPALDAHEIGVRAQRIPNAGAEAIGLDQDGHQLAQFGLSGAFRQIVQCLAAALPRAHLERHQAEFVTDILVGDTQFPGDTHKCLVQPIPRFHAHHHQVERIGQ